MDKIAQRRSLLNKIKEKANIGGIAAEKFFNPEFERVMDKLREFDSNLRSIALGQSVDGGDPGNDSSSLKDLLKEAESNFNRREYITAVALLGRFHQKMSELVNRINSLDMDVTKVHKDFLFKELDDEHKNILREMNKRFAMKRNKQSFIATAGIMDFLHNIGTTRGRALAAWEKRYPKQVKKLKKDTQNLLNKSNNLLNTLLNDFDKLADYRAKRQVDDYMKLVFKFKSLFNNYHYTFNTYYVENVKSFLNNDDYLDPPAQAPGLISTEETPKQSEITKTLIPVKNNESQEEINDETPKFTPEWIDVTYDRLGRKINVDENDDSEKSKITDSELLRQLAPSGLSGLLDPISNKNDENPDTISELTPDVDQELDDPLESEKSPDTAKSAHQKFYNELTTLANESPILMAKHIYIYAQKIKNMDEPLSNKLLTIYNNILEK